MRRFVTLALLLIFSIPVGISITGCAKHSAVDYCNGGSSGMVVGQITTINLEPRLYGVSLNYGGIGQISSPSALDCKGDTVGVVRYTYGTTDVTYADISPSGSICAGTWNRNTSGGVADYTTCTPPPAPAFIKSTDPTTSAGSAYVLNYGTNAGVNGVVDISLAGGPVLSGTITGTPAPAAFAAAFNNIVAFSSAGIVATSSGSSVVITGPVGVTKTLSFAGTSLTGYAPVPAAYITASAGGAVSNPVPIYIHPIVSSVQLTNTQTTCASQGTSTTLTAKVLTADGTDITALAGPLTFTPQDSSIVTINSSVLPPVATAQLPGSTILTASTSNASSSGSTSSTGIFSTCPPTNITLAAGSSTDITLNQNNMQALTATVRDKNNTLLTGLNLQYISTSPRTVAANASGQVTPTYPGAGTITALCQPPSCNNAPLSQLGVQGNGLPVTSNPIHVTTPGTVNTVLFMGSTHSQYFSNVDFQTGTVSPPVRLPYVPNSMVGDAAGTTLYLGSPTELMEVSTINNSLAKEDASVKGTVIGISQDGSVLVLSDAIHGLIYIYYTSGGSNVSFGGTATHAAFSPDNSTIYITGQYPALPPPPTPPPTVVDNFFVYSNYNGWHAYLLPSTPQDVAVSVPSISAFLAGTTTTERSYCAAGAPPTDFFPQVSTPQATLTDRLAVTNDSKHLLGATANTLTDFPLTTSTGTTNPGACSTFFNLTTPFSLPLGIAQATITGVVPESDSSLAFVTYTTAGTVSTGTKLPYYIPSASGIGTLSAVTLSNGATAPVSGIFSPDNQTFYTGTSGDNRVHVINVPARTDSGTLNPSLFLCNTQDVNGNCTSTATTFATPDLLSNRPRPTT